MLLLLELNLLLLHIKKKNKSFNLHYLTAYENEKWNKRDGKCSAEAKSLAAPWENFLMQIICPESLLLSFCSPWRKIGSSYYVEAGICWHPHSLLSSCICRNLKLIKPMRTKAPQELLNLRPRYLLFNTYWIFMTSLNPRFLMYLYLCFLPTGLELATSPLLCYKLSEKQTSSSLMSVIVLGSFAFIKQNRSTTEASYNNLYSSWCSESFPSLSREDP